MAILNGFGRSLGDGVIGLQALSTALGRGTTSSSPVLFRLPGLPPVQQQLYAAAEFAEVRTLPWNWATPERSFPPAEAFARTIDLRDFAFDPGFRGAAMIDFFLARLGVDPDQVPPAAKRNTWLASRAGPEPPQVRRGYVLLCPRSSMKLRDMPHGIVAAIVDWVRARGRALRPLGQAGSLAGLCGEIAAAALVVSTDTAVVHLADAFGVPCLAFFPTHRPERRVRDYPLCRAVHLPAPGLPDGLEFSRGPEDLAAAARAWFPHGHDLSWLHAALAAALPR